MERPRKEKKVSIWVDEDKDKNANIGDNSDVELEDPITAEQQKEEEEEKKRSWGFYKLDEVHSIIFLIKGVFSKSWETCFWIWGLILQRKKNVESYRNKLMQCRKVWNHVKWPVYLM